jgi:hypothetical protein
MIDIKNKNNDDSVIQAMFDAGAHFGYGRSKRHPSMKEVIFGVKGRVELFDLEKTKEYFDTARLFLQSVATSGKQILFISSKSESKDAIIKEIGLENKLAFEIEGIKERVAATIVKPSDAQEILKAEFGEKYKTDKLLLVKSKLRFPYKAKVSLIWAKGIESKSGVKTEEDKILAYVARAP